MMEQLEREWNVITFVSLFDLKGELTSPSSSSSCSGIEHHIT